MQPMPARRVFALFAALFALPSIATAAPGFAMRWDRCYADAGGSNKNFACNTNSGTETLVITFSPDTAIANLSGIEIYLDIQSASASIPAWWQMKNTGTCRQGAISVNMTADPSAVRCDDTFAGNAAGGIGAYNIFSPGPDRISMSIAEAAPQTALASVTPGREYFAANIKIDHTKSVGAGACVGCTTPMCLTIFQMRLVSPAHTEFIYGQEGPNSNTVGWQGGSPDIGFYKDTEFDHPWTTGWFNQACGLPTPARNQTWGAIKSMYR